MSKETVEMPEIPFGPHMISRLIVGGNQQQGASHQSRLMSLHMLEYYTEDRMVTFLKDCIAQGIDTWQANYSEKVRNVVTRLRGEGETINLISLSSPQMADQGEGWDNLMALEPIGVYLFGWVADQLYHQGKMEMARDFLAKVRDSGTQVGVGTHRPEVIEYAEEKGWDVDFYMGSLYRWGRSPEEILEISPEVPIDGLGGLDLYLPSELPRMCETLGRTDKTCIAFKLFAGGRTCNSPEQVSDIVETVLGGIKSTDAVCIGMYPRFSDEIKEDADLVRKFG